MRVHHQPSPSQRWSLERILLFLISSLKSTANYLAPLRFELFGRYEIVPGAVPGKMNIKFADAIERDWEGVVLKLFPENKGHLFGHSLEMHRQLRRSLDVCTYIAVVVISCSTGGLSADCTMQCLPQDCKERPSFSRQELTPLPTG